jgi:hypothetical protein
MRATALASRFHVPPIRCGTALIVILAATISCASPDDPGSGITLLVSNGTCDAGHCDAVRVYAFPDDQPHTPGGMWKLHLGTVSTPSACLELPRSATFRVTGYDDAGNPDQTSTYEWTVDRMVSLAGLLPSEPSIPASPSTPQFVPGNASGWSVTLPGGAAASPAAVCAPFP